MNDLPKPDRARRAVARAEPAAQVSELHEPTSRAERREALLQAALCVIRRDGPGASMDAMAAEAGITKPILYRHFRDREGLVAAVASRFADELVMRLSQALASETDQRLRIEAALRSYVDFIEEDPSLYGFLTREVRVASPVLVGVVDRVAVVLRGAIAQALHDAGLSSQPAETWAYGVVGMVHLAGARWAAQPPGPKEELVSNLVQLVAEGLMGSSAAMTTPAPTAAPSMSAGEDPPQLGRSPENRSSSGTGASVVS